MTIVHDPKNQQPLNKLYAVISRDKDGNEGIVATEIGQWITGSEKIRDMFINAAKKAYLTSVTDKKLFVVEYVKSTFGEEIK